MKKHTIQLSQQKREQLEALTGKTMNVQPRFRLRLSGQPAEMDAK